MTTGRNFSGLRLERGAVREQEPPSSSRRSAGSIGPGRPRRCIRRSGRYYLYDGAAEEGIPQLANCPPHRVRPLVARPSGHQGAGWPRSSSRTCRCRAAPTPAAAASPGRSRWCSSSTAALGGSSPRSMPVAAGANSIENSGRVRQRGTARWANADLLDAVNWSSQGIRRLRWRQRRSGLASTCSSSPSTPRRRDLLRARRSAAAGQALLGRPGQRPRGWAKVSRRQGDDGKKLMHAMLTATSAPSFSTSPGRSSRSFGSHEAGRRPVPSARHETGAPQRSRAMQRWRTPPRASCPARMTRVRHRYVRATRSPPRHRRSRSSALLGQRLV